MIVPLYNTLLKKSDKSEINESTETKNDGFRNFKKSK